MPVYAQEVVGRNLHEIVSACLYFYALETNKKWLRRRVETMNFESELTLRKNLTLDIDFDILKRLRKKYLQSSRLLYIPLQQGMRRTPILDVGVTLDGKSEVALARRRENATIGAAMIVGYVLQSFYSTHPFPLPADFSRELSWVPILIDDLIEFESAVDIFPGKLTPSTWQLPKGIPREVEKCIRDSDGFGRYLLKYLAQYTLCAVIRAESQSSPDIRAVKLSRQEPILHDHTPPHSSERSFLIRNIFHVFSGTEYMLPLSNFGMHTNGGNHVKLQAPKGMSIDSVEVFRGDNVPLPLERRGEPGATRKFWSVHYGYDVSLAADSSADATDTDGRRRASFKIALEVMYNRRKVELHDRGLPMYKSRQQVRDPSMSLRKEPWQVRLSMSSKRSRFLVPTLGLLVCTVYALFIAMVGMDKGGNHGSLISSVSTLGLPLLLGFLVVGEEHLVLSRTLGLVRSIVGLATVAFVMTACTLAAGVSGLFAYVLFGISMLIGILAIGMVCIIIVRIQIFRTDSFEAFRYLVTGRFHELIDRRLAILNQGLAAYQEIELTRLKQKDEGDETGRPLPSPRKAKSRLRRLKRHLFRVHTQSIFATLSDDQVYNAWCHVISEAVSEVGIESARTVDRMGRLSRALVGVLTKI